MISSARTKTTKCRQSTVINEKEEEQDLKESNKHLQDVTNQMKSQPQVLAVQGQSHHLHLVGGKKSWSECSGQYQRRRQIAKSVCSALTIVKDDIFKPSRVELIETREVLVVDDKGKATLHQPKTQHKQDTTVEKTLYIKEKYISSKAYHELSMVNKDMPRSCTLSMPRIWTLTGQAHGVQ